MSTALSSRPTMVRHLVVLVTTLVAVLLYLDRVCAGIASQYIREDLGLKQADMGLFIGFFFYSYALAQVPSGWFSDRYGARIMLVIYILSWSVFTAFIGAATSLVLLLGMRLGCGLGQAGAYPTAGGLIKRWVPLTSRGLASAIVSFGGRVGGAIAPLLTAALMIQFVPLSEDVSLKAGDILQGGRLCALLAYPEDSADRRIEAAPADNGAKTIPVAALAHVWTLLPAEARNLVARIARDDRVSEGGRLSPQDAGQLVGALNTLLDEPRLYDAPAFQGVAVPKEPLGLLERKKKNEPLTPAEQRRLNRFLLQGLFPDELARLEVGGWRPVMVLYGAAGLLVAGLFWLAFRNRPAVHPWCNAAEAALIAGDSDQTLPSQAPGAPPLRGIVSNVSMWMNCGMQFSTNIGWIFLISSELPRYLGSVHGLNVVKQGWIASTALFVGMAGMVGGGMVTDWLVPRVGLKWGRRLPMAITRFTGAAAFAVCLVLPASSGLGSLSGPTLVFAAAVSVVAFSTDLGNPALWAYCQDVGGRHVGSILGWGNMWGNLGAAIGPWIYSRVLGETPATGDWNRLFALCAGAFVVSGLCAMGVDATSHVGPKEE